MLQNNFQVLPFYDSIEKQNHRKPYAFGQAYPLIASKSLLPFQLNVESFANRDDLDDIVIYSAEIVYLTTGEVLDISDGLNAGLVVTNVGNSDRQLLTWAMPSSFTVDQGLAYLKVVDIDRETTYYSEVFCLTDDLSRYVKLDWWDNDSEGNPDFIHTLYIDTIVGKPKYELDEEGTDRDGYFFVEKQISKKIHRFSFVAPEYLCDALRVVPMADNIQVTFNGDTHACDRIVIEPEWEEQGDLAAVDVELTIGTVVKKIAAGWPK